MIRLNDQTPLINARRFIGILLVGFIIYSCKLGSPKQSIATVDTIEKFVTQKFIFKPNLVQGYDKGVKVETDTINGYHKYYSYGKLQAEGKVSKGVKDFRDSIWKYYSEDGLLIRQEAYNSKGKVNSIEFMYFNNSKRMSEAYEYFEGDFKDKKKFKFHKIETLFYINGKPLSERHSINGRIVETKC